MQRKPLTISRWGNSLGVRIPKRALEKLGLTENEKLDYEVTNQGLLLKARPKNDFEKLFDGFDIDAYYDKHQGNKEYDFGKPMGQEIF